MAFGVLVTHLCVIFGKIKVFMSSAHFYSFLLTILLWVLFMFWILTPCLSQCLQMFSNSTPGCVCICMYVCVYIYTYMYIYGKMKILIWKDMCTSVFTRALFPITKAWKQPTHPSTEDCPRGWDVCVCVCVYIHTMAYYLSIKNEILLVRTVFLVK